MVERNGIKTGERAPAKRRPAGRGETITAKQRLWLRVLLILIAVAVLTGFLVRAGIGKKLGKDMEKAEAFCSEGKFEDALQIIEEISAKYPRFRKRGVVYFHAVCLDNLGRVEEAKVLWKKVIGSRADRRYYPASLYRLARFRETEGEYDKAIADYKKILSEYGSSDIVPEVLVSLGDCYQKKRKWKEATKRYREVLSSYEKSPVFGKAKEKLGDLNVRLVFSPYVTEDDIIYEVKSGDTLEKIALDFNTTVSLIRKANRFTRKVLPYAKRLKLTPGNFEIHVNADTNFLTLELNGRFFKEYPVGTGKFGCTPTGKFKIVNKQRNPVWYSEEGIFPYGHKKNILGTRWIGIDKTGYGIHGTAEPDTIGKHASRGCIRLFNRDVEQLYILATVGTPVTITGTTVSDAEEEVVL